MLYTKIMIRKTENAKSEKVKTADVKSVNVENENKRSENVKTGSEKSKHVKGDRVNSEGVQTWSEKSENVETVDVRSKNVETVSVIQVLLAAPKLFWLSLCLGALMLSRAWASGKKLDLTASGRESITTFLTELYSLCPLVTWCSTNRY